MNIVSTLKNVAGSVGLASALVLTGCGGENVGVESVEDSAQALLAPPKNTGITNLGNTLLKSQEYGFCATLFADKLISRPCERAMPEQRFALFQAADNNLFLCLPRTVQKAASQTCDENGCGPETQVYVAQCLVSASTDLVMGYVDIAVSQDNGQTYQSAPGLLIPNQDGTLGYLDSPLKVTVDPYRTELVLDVDTGAPNQKWTFEKR